MSSLCHSVRLFELNIPQFIHAYCNSRRGTMRKRRGHVVFHINQSYAFHTSVPHLTFRISQFHILPTPYLLFGLTLNTVSVVWLDVPLRQA